MELRHIHYFLVLAEEKNVTKAAEKLCIAQPPLSRQIKDLEEELGSELFIRSNKGVRLTAAGEKFLDYALQIEHLADQSKEALKDVSNGLQGTLFLATVEGRAPHMLAEWIADFHKKYPKVVFNLWNGNSDDVTSRLENRLCDIAIICGPYDSSTLEGLYVYTEPWAAIMSCDHPLAKKHPSKPGKDTLDTISVKELAPYELIIPSKQSRLHEISGWFDKDSPAPAYIGRLAHTLDAYELAEQNVGIAIYPASASIYKNNDRICVKRLVNPEVSAKYYLARIAGRQMTPVAEKFWEHVEQLVIAGDKF